MAAITHQGPRLQGPKNPEVKYTLVEEVVESYIVVQDPQGLVESSFAIASLALDPLWPLFSKLRSAAALALPRTSP